MVSPPLPSTPEECVGAYFKLLFFKFNNKSFDYFNDYFMHFIILLYFIQNSWMEQFNKLN